MLKIINLDPDRYSDEALHIISSVGVVENYRGSYDNLMSIIHEFHIVIMRFSHIVDKNFIDCAKNLKIIACNAKCDGLED